MRIDADNTPRTATLSADVEIGTTPAGSVWVAYAGRNTLNDVANMRIQLAAVWARHAAKRERELITVRLSAAVLFFVNGVFTTGTEIDVEDNGEMDPIVFGRTYLRTTRRAVAFLASALQEHADEYADQISGNAETDAQLALCERNAARSLEAADRAFGAALNAK